MKYRKWIRMTVTVLVGVPVILILLLILRGYVIGLRLDAWQGSLRDSIENNGEINVTKIYEYEGTMFLDAVNLTGGKISFSFRDLKNAHNNINAAKITQIKGLRPECSGGINGEINAINVDMEPKLKLENISQVIQRMDLVYETIQKWPKLLFIHPYGKEGSGRIFEFQNESIECWVWKYK